MRLTQLDAANMTGNGTLPGEGIADPTPCGRRIRQRVRRIVLGVGDNVVNSISNFTIAVLAAHLLTARFFGIYALIYSLYAVLLAITQGGVGEPFLVRGTPEREPEALGAAWLLGSAFGLLAVLGGLLLAPGHFLLWAACGLLVPWLAVQEALRWICLSKGNPGDALLSDLIWLGAVLVGGGILLLANPSQEILLPLLLLVWTLSALLACALILGRRVAWPQPRQGLTWTRSTLELSRDYIPEHLVHASGGSLILYVIAAFASLSQVAGYRGALLLMSPLSLLLGSLPSVVVPELRRKAEERLRAGYSQLLAVLVGIAIINVAVLQALPPAALRLVVGESWPETRDALLVVGLGMIPAAANTAGLVILRWHKASKDSRNARLATIILQVVAGGIGAWLAEARGAAIGVALAALAMVPVWGRAAIRASRRQNKAFASTPSAEVARAIDDSTTGTQTVSPRLIACPWQEPLRPASRQRPALIHGPVSAAFGRAPTNLTPGPRSHNQAWLTLLAVALTWALVARFDSSLALLLGLLNVYICLREMMRTSTNESGGPIQAVFWAMMLVWLALSSVVQLHLRILPWPDSGQDSWFAWAQLLTTASLSAFAFGAWAKRRHHPTSSVRQGQTARLRVWVPLTIALGLLPLVLKETGGIGGRFTTRDALSQLLTTSGIASDTTHLFLINRLPAAAVIVGLFLAMVHLNRARHRKMALGALSAWTPALIAILLAVLLVNPFTTSRYDAFAALLAVVFGSIRFDTKRRRVVMALAITAGLLTAYPLATYFKKASTRVAAPSYGTKAFTSVDFDGFQQTVNTLSYVQTHGITYGTHILAAFAYFIPRSLWTSKPLPASIIIAADRGYEFQNLSLPLPSELYLDTGLLGMLIIMTALGYFAQAMDSSYASHPDSIRHCFVMLVALAEPGLIRGPLGASVVTFGTILVIGRLGLTNQHHSELDALRAETPQAPPRVPQS